MIVDDQHEVIAWLGSPEAHGGLPVEQIETHSAVVFLAGSRAWKMKRAVRYDYLDFSTPEIRRRMCEAEVRLNKRTAPRLYHGVVSVTREADGTLALGGTGAPAEWVVEMNRFEQRNLCDRLAADGALDLTVTGRLATVIAAFHRGAAPRDDHGGRDALVWVVEGNAADLTSVGSEFLDLDAVMRLTRQSLAAIAAHGPLLDARRAAGFVRQCHGDLHLRNIVLLEGEPTLFDAVEFNDDIACIDTWYDVAFLLMDLAQRGLTRHANVVMNRYLGETADFDGLPLLPLFLSCRAAIRAKTSATAATMQSDAGRVGDLQSSSRRYLEMAGELLQPSRPQLVAIGGLSGTGKSSLAAHIAAHLGVAPGAVVLRSDEIRKELAGVSPLSRLGPDGYSSEMSARVYVTMKTRAANVLAAGRSVIADAVFARAHDRDAIEQAAAAAGVPFAGLWLHAPAGVLVERAKRRQAAADDVSDADQSVIQAQLQEPVGRMRWTQVDAGVPLTTVAARARELVSASSPQSPHQSPHQSGS